MRRLLHPPRVELVGEEYGESARLVLRLERRHAAALGEALAAGSRCEMPVERCSPA